MGSKAPSRCSSGLRHILLPQATAKHLLTQARCMQFCAGHKMLQEPRPAAEGEKSNGWFYKNRNVDPKSAKQSASRNKILEKSEFEQPKE